MDRWTYDLKGDGDGVEFLFETAHRSDGRLTCATVVLANTGASDA